MQNECQKLLHEVLIFKKYSLILHVIIYYGDLSYENEKYQIELISIYREIIAN